MAKYYEVKGAQRRVAGVPWFPYDSLGGVTFGVYGTDDPVLIATLDAEAANPASGVTEITHAQYEGLSKKKAPSLKESTLLTPPPQMPVSVSSPVAVVVEGDKARGTGSAGAKEGPETIEEALNVGVVSPAEAVETVTATVPPVEKTETNLNLKTETKRKSKAKTEL